MKIYPLELGLQEDCPYADITTELLKIEGGGRMKLITREDAVITGVFRLRDFFESQKLEVLFCQKPGELIESGDTIIEAVGDLKILFKMWRISQTYLTTLCAIATKTRQIVNEAKEANPDVEIVVACRKAHLGMRQEEIEAVEDGGGLYHRNSLSDTVLITQNHLRMLGELPIDIKSFHHKIEIEPRNEEEAYQCASFCDVILLDHFEAEALPPIVKKIKKLNSQVKVGVAGGIQGGNIKEFAKTVDLIVFSSVLYAPPLDFTCKIEGI
ncbi:MAG: Quinolinate phosphoribosyl transferase [Firmicutes bacterium]|nr:Quinolinate phosphoribosyl transferase [Bacillota bacterium]MBP2659410.1 Quinolinate phosphoribosyl transferase [Bacillota bacterium]